MARSPLVAQATRDLAKYFQAITDGTFIDRSWAVKGSVAANAGSILVGGTTQIDAATAIRDIGAQNVAGTYEAEHIANLINSSIGIGPFFNILNSEIPERYKNEFKFYRVESDTRPETKEFKMKELESDYFTFLKDAPNEIPTKTAPNVYSINVYNPYLGPTTRDSGPIEIFMNSIPTLEFSRCVPYINFELITTRKEAGKSSPPPSLSMIGFLNPAGQGSADAAMLRGQAESVKSEVLDLGIGIRSGIELFTMPQTLVNLGPTGAEFVPVIDRFRPLASLDNLSLSTKMQGGTLSFTTGKIEITVFDRSRLREVAAFVRPDLYGTTFLDITHGWSHPDGGIDSKNTFGKFLDALKTETRYRVSNSSFSFEEGGKIKITLSIQSVGSIDCLYLGPRGTSIESREMTELCRTLSERISTLQGRATSPSMEALTTLSTFSDPADVMSASINSEKIKEIREAVNNLGDPVVSRMIDNLIGTTTKKGELDGEVNSAVERIRSKTLAKYTEIINSLPPLGDPKDPLAADFIAAGRTPLLNISTVILKDEREKNIKQGTENLEYVSYGSVFMKMVVEPMQISGQYEEIQTIFYPFNDHAGAVRQLPISCFPIEKNRFIKSFEEISKGSPELSLRDVIKVLQERFVGFIASRPYLMAGFYDQKKVAEGIAAETEPKYTEIKADTPEIVAAREKAKSSAEAAEKFKNADLNSYAKTAAEQTAAADAAGIAVEQQSALLDSATKNQTAANQIKAVRDAAKENAKALAKAANNYLDVNRALTFERRLLAAGILDKKWVMPKVEVAVEASKLLDASGAPVVDGKGNTKTLLKIHVYDSSMDPHSTLTDIIMAANDKGLGVISAPLAAYNAAELSSAGAGDSKKSAAIEAIQAGIDAGILKEIDLATGSASVASGNASFNGTKYYAIAADYDKVKSLVSAGMPTITYGSSLSAITSANLTTSGNAAMANVLLQRAFAPPGETAPDNIDSGVPMQVIPASLSISTFGCPLFYPMQRFFIDFGTGTSLDSIYYVLSIDTNIGSGGYKTDVKFAYSAGFATYTSLNQNLAMISARLAPHVTEAERAAATPPVSKVNPDVLLKNEQRLASSFRNTSVRVITKSAEAINNVAVAVAAEAKRAEGAALAELAQAEAVLKDKANNILGPAYLAAQAAQKEATTKILAAQAKVSEAEEYAARGRKILDLIAEVRAAEQELNPEIVKTIAAQIKAEQELNDKYVKENKDAEAASKK